MIPLLMSHFSLISCMGSGRAATLAELRSEQSKLIPCNFETAAINTFIGRVEGVEEAPITGRLARYDCRNNRLAQMALDQDGFAAAVADAKNQYGAHRIGLFTGTSTTGLLDTEIAFRRCDPISHALPEGFRFRESYTMFSLGDFVQQSLGLEGPALVISAACASTAKAFASTARMIELDWCDAAVVGGADSLCLSTLYGFRSLQLTAETPCRPYDATRSGISISEAAGFALLERADHARVNEGVLLIGTGESSDAYHMSSPDPEGRGSRLAMSKALTAASLSPGDIDYINLHGTATRVGDAAEDRAVAGLFGKATPCNSTKGQTGHALGTAAMVEAVISALSILHSFIPGSPATTQVDPSMQCMYTVKETAQPVRRVMSNSFGFGGSNCSLIFARA